MSSSTIFQFAIALLIAAASSSTTVTFSPSCPFQQALGNGQFAATLIERHRQQLIDAVLLLGDGQPASIPWENEALTEPAADRFDRANSLLLAKQFYAQQLHAENASDSRDSGRPRWTVEERLRSVADCLPVRDRCETSPRCDAEYRHPITSGQCNNLRYPKWGAAYSPYGRLVPPVFDDGMHTVRRSVTNAPLPSPRLVGNFIADIDSYKPPPQRTPNYGSVMFGQYIAHDVGNRNVYQNKKGGPGLNCCPYDQAHMPSQHLTYHGCDAIEIPADDPFYQQFAARKRCMSYVRTQPTLANDCSIDTTEMSNSVSHHVDQSNIYGSDDTAQESVRLFRGGQLRIANDVAALKPGCTGDFCYYSGDSRAMLNPTLGLWHSVWMRFHNLVAARLEAAQKSGDRDDERLFQQARRLVTAVYQQVVFNEWLPLYVGREEAERRGVACPKGGRCRGRYDERVNPSTVNEFAVGAFRMFHVNLPARTNFYDENFKRSHSMQLNDTIMGSAVLEQLYEPVMRGLLHDPIRIGTYPSYMRNELFNNGNADGIGLDLLAVDIARGRDHGLAPYHVYLTAATGGRVRVSGWDDLAGHFSAESVRALQQVYACSMDVDLLVGLLLEEKRGELAGPVGRYIVEEQFYRFKYGNRFFYSLVDGPRPFADDQLEEINAQSFASVLCAVSEIKEVFERAFEVPSKSNKRIRCRDLKEFNVKRCMG